MAPQRAVLLLVLASTTAARRSRGGPCAASIARFCGRGSGKVEDVRTCLRANVGRLDAKCESTVRTRQEIHAACAAETTKLCPAVERSGRYPVACLRRQFKRRRNEFSEKCGERLEVSRRAAHISSFTPRRRRAPPVAEASRRRRRGPAQKATGAADKLARGPERETIRRGGAEKRR